MKNYPHVDLAGKAEYGYGGGSQYCGSSGTGHSSYDTLSYILSGMPTAGLPQSHKDTYNRWDNIVGKIASSVFLVCFFHCFYFS